MADGGWRMADGGWRMVDGGWRMADGKVLAMKDRMRWESFSFGLSSKEDDTITDVRSTSFFFPITEEEHLLIHLGSCREGKRGVKQLHFEKCKQMKLLSTLPSATSPKNKK
jgi:hypothetical protein